MAISAVGQPPPPEVVKTLTSTLAANPITYALTLNPNTSKPQKNQLKPIQYLHGEPRLIWEYEEIAHMIVEEDLQYAVIGKFTYGWPEMQDLRTLIPKQSELKGKVNIGLLCNRYVLIKASNLKDYVTLLSKPQFYITHKHWSYPMSTLKWDPLFDP
ncbi:hypothetical protein KY289_013518 [Solanum tuberosum]|nr:hypothetical protein KY289_013518 [Solanum tuberosum]